MGFLNFYYSKCDITKGLTILYIYYISQDFYKERNDDKNRQLNHYTYV